ncbi:hypothetical protein B7463_g3569, partial [Scytalidium lignicola]
MVRKDSGSSAERLWLASAQPLATHVNIVNKTNQGVSLNYKTRSSQYTNIPLLLVVLFSVSMASIVDPKDRKRKSRRILHALDKIINNLSKFQFSRDDLEPIQIRVIPASFECREGELDFDPCFFRPYSAGQLSAPEDGHSEIKYPEYTDKVSQYYEGRPIECVRPLAYYFSHYFTAVKSLRPDAKITAYYDSGWSSTEYVIFT